MEPSYAQTTPCRSCGRALRVTVLACPQCGTLVHRDRLEHLSRAATQQEAIDPRMAAETWSRCLELLPPESKQYQQIAAKIGTLAMGIRPAVPLEQSATAPKEPKPQSLQVAILITIVSGAISAAVYAMDDGWPFAAGFVACILVHELGHTVACLLYGLRASAPIFIPGLGALILLRQQPPNAKVEAVIGIAGPIGGLIAAIGCYFIFVRTGSPLAAELVQFGAIINLLNLVPMHPLDGGRIARGMPPGVWLVVALVGFRLGPIAQQLGIRTGVLILIAGATVIGISRTIRQRHGEYYNISKEAGWLIGISYLAVAGALLWLWWRVREVV